MSTTSSDSENAIQSRLGSTADAAWKTVQIGLAVGGAYFAAVEIAIKFVNPYFRWPAEVLLVALASFIVFTSPQTRQIESSIVGGLSRTIPVSRWPKIVFLIGTTALLVIDALCTWLVSPLNIGVSHFVVRPVPEVAKSRMTPIARSVVEKSDGYDLCVDDELDLADNLRSYYFIGLGTSFSFEVCRKDGWNNAITIDAVEIIVSRFEPDIPDVSPLIGQAPTDAPYVVLVVLGECKGDGPWRFEPKFVLPDRENLTTLKWSENGLPRIADSLPHRFIVKPIATTPGAYTFTANLRYHYGIEGSRTVPLFTEPHTYLFLPSPNNKKNYYPPPFDVPPREGSLPAAPK